LAEESLSRSLTRFLSWVRPASFMHVWRNWKYAPSLDLGSFNGLWVRVPSYVLLESIQLGIILLIANILLGWLYPLICAVIRHHKSVLSFDLLFPIRYYLIMKSDNIFPVHGSDDCIDMHPIAAGLARWVDVEDEDARKLLLESLGKYFENIVLLETSSHEEALQFVYGQNDNKTYDVLSIRNEDHYDMFVTPSNDKFHEVVRFSASNFLKASGRYEKEQLHFQLYELEKNCRQLKKILRKDYIFTSRVATGNTVDSVEYPSLDKLKIFYECERKVQYDSPDESISALHTRCHFYSCEYCGKYHQGRPRQEGTLKTPDDVEMMKRYRRVWNQYHRDGSKAAKQLAARGGIND
jgi:hypothetical protein